MRVLVAVGVAAVVAASCGGGGGGVDGDDPVAVTRAWLQAMHDSNGERACDLVTTQFRQRLADRDMLGRGCAHYVQAYYRASWPNVDEITFNNPDGAGVIFHWYSPEGIAVIDTLDLDQVHGEWRVAGWPYYAGGGP